MNSDKLIEALKWSIWGTPDEKAKAETLYWEAKAWQEQEEAAQELYAKALQSTRYERQALPPPFFPVAQDILNQK